MNLASPAPTAGDVGDGPVEALPPLPPRRTAYYSLFVLTMVVMFTGLDRQILALMIDPMKADFGISDTRAAILLGASYSLPYAIAGMPIARYADFGNRRKLIAACIAVWSTATLLCGFAQNFWQLMFARLGLGVGESGYGPATWSIINDSFPRERVAFGTAVLGIGVVIGTGLALFFGGAVLAFVKDLPPTPLPFGAVIRSWQWGFILVGAPGVLWALMVLSTREPARRIGARHRDEMLPVREVVAFMVENRRVYIGVIGGLCMKMLMMLGSSQWMPTLYHRQFGWSLTRVGLITGSVALVVSPISMIIGSKISERWMKSGRGDANMRIMLYVLLCTVPLYCVAPLMPSPWLVLGCNSLALALNSLGMGPGAASFQIITPGRMRAQVSSVYQFSTHVISLALGPLIVALFTDYLFGGPQHLRYSIALNVAVMGPITILLVWQGLKPYGRAIERAQREGY